MEIQASKHWGGVGTLKAFLMLSVLLCGGRPVCAKKKVNRNGTSSAIQYESLT